MVFVLIQEGLTNKIEKCSADIILDFFTERRVVPDDISLSVASRSCRLFVCCRSVSPYSRWLSKLSYRLVWPC